MKPFKLTMPVPLEQDIHKACARTLDALLKHPAVWFTYPAGVVELSPAQAARYSELGLKRGLPDIWIIYDGVWCIELKRPGGTLSKSSLGKTRSGGTRFLVGQEDMFPRLISAGVRDIKVCHSVAEVLAQLEQWRIPLRGRVAA